MGVSPIPEGDSNLESAPSEHVYTEARYAARTWDQARRIVIKAEVVRLEGRAPRDNQVRLLRAVPSRPSRDHRLIGSATLMLSPGAGQGQAALDRSGRRTPASSLAID